MGNLLRTRDNTFVHIIESPGPEELLDGRTEGRALSSFLELAGISSQYSMPADEDTLRTVFHERIVQSMEEYRYEKYPIIHISAHGNTTGIGLTNGSLVSWETLAGFLRMWNNTISNTLLVCLSSCHGMTGASMAITRDVLPMETLVSAKGKVKWDSAALAFLTFYHHLLSLQHPIDDCVKAMRAAAGCNNFDVAVGKDVQDVCTRIADLSPDGRARLAEELRTAFPNHFH